MNNSFVAVLNDKVMVVFVPILHLEHHHLNTTLFPFVVNIAQLVVNCWLCTQPYDVHLAILY
jgi:hypothetical protein